MSLVELAGAEFGATESIPIWLFALPHVVVESGHITSSTAAASLIADRCDSSDACSRRNSLTVSNEGGPQRVVSAPMGLVSQF